MQPTANSETDRAVEITPEISHTVAWRVTSVTVLRFARLQVRFVDGTAGEVDMRAFLSNASLEGTVFERLRDAAEFSQVQIVMGAVQWPSGADLAPDAMYDAIRESGVWVVE